jgi:Fe-S-cluster-containing dehydrogenase component
VTGTAGFVVDLARCVGCGACVLACRLEHGWPASAPRRRLLTLNDRRHPAGPTYFLSLACHHCERPACVAACPSGAYERRMDGIVQHREERCVGCRYCEMACPFGGPRFDAVRGIVGKCDFCRARADRGEAPACVTACPTEALVERGHHPGSAGKGEDETTSMPGFEDSTGCRPSIRFRPPRGLRGKRLAELLTQVVGRR